MRHRLERYLNRFTPEQQDRVLIGALASLYTNPDSTSDGGLWLLGEKTERGYTPGIAQRTIQALRHTGIIGEPVLDQGAARLDFAPPPEAQEAGAGTLADLWYHMDRALHG